MFGLNVAEKNKAQSRQPERFPVRHLQGMVAVGVLGAEYFYHSVWRAWVSQSGYTYYKCGKKFSLALWLIFLLFFSFNISYLT